MSFSLLGRSSLVALGGLLLGASACRAKVTPPDREPPVGSAAGLASAAASGSAAARASAGPAPEAKPTPVFVPETFAPGKSHPEAIFRIEGAIVVTEGLQVSRLVGETLEPIGKIPPGGPALGEHLINQVSGRWPDAVDVTYSNAQGRAPEPTYFPLTGKGKMHITGEGGMSGGIQGLATVGDTRLIAVRGFRDGYHLSVARGPSLVRRMQTQKQGGCKPEEASRFDQTDPPAVIPDLLVASPAGTLLTIGRLCDREKTLSAEIWDREGKSRLVDISGLTKASLSSDIVPGTGDELWFGSDENLLHYKDGTFEMQPGPGPKIHQLFASPRGQLYVASDRAIHRRDGDRWTLLGTFTWPSYFRNMVVDDQGTIWVGGGVVARLREQPGVGPAGCTTPFVHLYDVGPDNPVTFTFPATRKALASFADVDSLGLVEVNEGGTRRLGVKVTSQAQGEAVIAHVKTTMPDEKPRLLCYEPRAPRVIALSAKK